MPPYSLQDVVASYRWLGHRNGFTELNAFHRDYRPAPEHASWNASHNLFPKIWYAEHEGDVIRFVKEHYQYHMLCYGINPRARIFKKHGPRSAREDEIETSQNLLLDIDVETPEPSEQHLAAVDSFLTHTNEYFLDLRLRAPVKAFTGRGYHLLFAFPDIKVADCLDIGARLKLFSEDFREAYRLELAHFEAKLDSTQDLRRMARIYGTAKPTVGIISKFYARERIEDEALRSHLLDMRLSPSDPYPVLNTSRALPTWFEHLLDQDATVRDLWSGTGKAETFDTSHSGYDYSLTLRLLRLGYRNLDDLATILVLRPEGSVQKTAKGEMYVRRTIANAMLRPGALGDAR